MKKIISIACLSAFCSIAIAQNTYTLEQILDSARQNNIKLGNARRNIEVAEEQRKEAYTKYFPSVSAIGLWFNANKGMAETSLNPSEMVPPELASTLAASLPPEALGALANPIDVSMMKNGTIAGITASQPVFAGGQIVNGNKLAKVGEEAARLQLELSDNEVEKTVTQYYWQLVALQEKTKTLDVAENLLKGIYKDVDVAVKAGVAMRNDLLQVQLRLNDIESQRLKLNNGIDIVRLMLMQYAGLTGDGSKMFNVAVPKIDSLSVVLPEAPSANAAHSLTLLPEYQLLGKQVEAADLQRKMAFGQNLPTVAVGAGYNYHNLMERNHSFAMVFATVSVPISDWWGGSHAVKRKKIEYQNALEEQRDNAELLTIRMQNAWNSVTESYQQLKLAERTIEQAEENLRLNRDFYRAGTSKMSDLLEAQLLHQQALDARTDAFAEYQKRMLDYRQSIGQ